MSKEDICPHTKTNGHNVCMDCGEVLDIDIRNNSYTSGTWRKSTQYTQSVYIGNSLGQIGNLGSDMGNRAVLKDVHHVILPKKKYRDYKRLQKYSRTYLNNSGRDNRLQIKLKGICKQLKINNNTIQKALYYFVRILKKEKDIPNKISLMAYCIYYATMEDKRYAPINVKRIIKIFNDLGHHINLKMLWKNKMIYSKYFPIKEISKPINYIYKFAADISNNSEVIRKLESKGYYGNKATFRQELENMAMMMLDKLPEGYFRGCAPTSIAATIMYSSGILLANKYNFNAKFLSQVNVGNSTGTHEYSIRTLYAKYIKPIFINQNLKFIKYKQKRK